METPSNDKKIMRVLLLTLFFNLVVCVAKLFYGIKTKSLSLEADGFHSLLDSSSNIVGLIGAYLAARPPDEGHPYGHRKIEALTSLSISFLLFMTCYEIISHVIGRIKNPVIPSVDTMSFAIMGITMAANFFVSRYEKREGTRLRSDILLADALHTRSDILVSISVILSFVAVLFHAPYLDGLIACGIVLYIFTIAFRILSGSVDVLLDARTIDPELVEDLVKKIPGIVRCHKIRSRGTRSGVFVDLHIHVDPNVTTEVSHKLTHDVIRTIKGHFPEVLDVLIHTEPAFATGKVPYQKS